MRKISCYKTKGSLKNYKVLVEEEDIEKQYWIPVSF